jgi:hypothetical protein
VVRGPASRWGIATLGITLGLFDEYSPAQRMYGRHGHIPDGRGACQGQRPLHLPAMTWSFKDSCFNFRPIDRSFGG